MHSLVGIIDLVTKVESSYCVSKGFFVVHVDVIVYKVGTRVEMLINALTDSACK